MNQSRPQGVSTRSVDFFTSFCIEIEPSEQVVWLWKSPATYVPGVAGAALQFTVTLSVSAQEAAGSPSLTVRPTVTAPGARQVSVGFFAAALESVPLVA